MKALKSIKVRTYFLFIGILLEVLYYVISYALDRTESLIQDPISLSLENCSLLFTFILVCVLAPVLEEYVFRYWANGNLVSRILAAIGIPLVVWTTFNWIVGLVVLVAVVLLLFVVKKDNFRLIAMAIISSVAFGVGHLGNYNDYDFILPVMSCTGLGLMALYFVLRWNIWAAIGLHFVNNFAALLLSQILIIGEPQMMHIRSDNFSLEMIQVQDWSFSFKVDGSADVSDSLLVMKNVTMSEIVRELLPEDNSYLLVNNVDSRVYDLKVDMKSCADMSAVSDSLISRFEIKFDTLSVPGDGYYYLTIADRLGREEESLMSYIPVSMLTKPMLDVFDKIFVYKIDCTRRLVPMDLDTYGELRKCDDFEKFVSTLSEYGVYVNPVTNHKLVVITSCN